MKNAIVIVGSAALAAAVGVGFVAVMGVVSIAGGQYGTACARFVGWIIGK